MIKFRFHIPLFIACLFFTLKITGQNKLPEIKLLAQPKENKILLRWAVNEASVWKKANQYGYFLERTLISKNGQASLPLKRKILNNGKPFLPAPLPDWEEPFDKDPSAAIIAQALYGEGFQAGNLDPVASIMAINEELQQRFVFALVAAEQSFDAAKLAGWGYEDTEVVPGEKYLYKIWIATPNNETIAKDASVYSSVDFYKPLPKPLEPLALFSEHKVDISWDFTALQQTYTSYDVERSVDNVTFKKINNYPIFNAEKPKSNKPISLSYTDSIPNSTQFYYRIKGHTSFGETGPASNATSGIAKETLKFVPQITRKQIIKDDTVILEWEFDEKANAKIQGFDLLRSNTDRESFKTVATNISPSTRTYTYSPLKRINYFKIVAKGVNGDSRPSHAAIVQPVDSIPPKRPKALTGTIDTTGIVKLKWIANTEPDLGGYRIFRSNNAKSEFFEITKSVIKSTHYTDTIPVKNLNKHIYYKLVAQDQRYNASKASEILTIEKPDLLPPSPTVMRKYEIIDNTVLLHWIPSSSDDVIEQRIYRSKDESSQWELIETLEIAVTEFKDVDLEEANYRYVILAVDNVGLESAPKSVLDIEITKPPFQDLIKKFTATPNREARSILLSWKTNIDDITEVQLYKSESERLNLFKVLDADENNFEDTDLAINSTYWYGIKVVNKNGVESNINIVKVTY